MAKLVPYTERTQRMPGRLKLHGPAYPGKQRAPRRPWSARTRFPAVAIALLAGATGAAVSAQTPNPDLVGPMIQRPDWVVRPDGEDLADAYPELAQILELEAETKIPCVVTVAGNLQDCVVVSERPTGFGFGEAALSLAPSFQMRPQTVVDLPSEATVSIPIRWRLPDSARRTSLPKPRPDPQRLILARRLVEPLAAELALIPAPDGEDPLGLDDPVAKTAAEMVRLTPMVMQERKADFASRIASAYAETYSLDELQALVAFVETPAGRGFWSKTGRLNAAMQEQSAEFQELVMAVVRDRLCATRNCLVQTAEAPVQP